MGRYIQQDSSINSIVEALALHAGNMPDKLALRIGKESCTYRELWALILKVRNKGIYFAKGSVIILSAEKSITFIAHYFASHLNGHICILADPKLSITSIENIASRYKAKAFFSNKGELDGICNIRYNHTEIDATKHPVAFPARESIADLMFTTGTTGESKSVPLSHGNLLASAENINTFIGNTQNDHELIALPLCHSFGLGRVRCALLAGGTCTIIPNFANEKKLLATLSEETITGFSMVPAAWQYIRHLCAERFITAAKHLHFIEIGSAPLALEDKEFLSSKLPHTRICMHYGLTEASRSAFMEFHADADRLSSNGKATPGVDISIYSAEGIQLGANEPGEVCIRGNHVTRGYLNFPREESFYGEYFRTGDMGMLKADGTLYILGRIKELINVGGKKVSPDEVESKIIQYPGVKECACTAANDPSDILGEVVKAHIVPQADTQIDIPNLLHFLRNLLEPHKVPRIVELCTTALPRTESGKLQRQKLL